MTIRVLLADDQKMVRSGLAMLLSAAGLTVVGEAADGSQAVDLARQLEPDVVIMDLAMPVMDGVEATRRLTADDFLPTGATTVKVLVLTTFSAHEQVYEALRAGASGFLLKDGAATDLVTAVTEVHAGNAYLDPAVTPAVIAELAHRRPPTGPIPGLLDRLTKREKEILTLMAYGLSNRNIAGQLVLSEATVKTHVSRVIMKLDADGRTQAVVAAYQNHLVVPDNAR